MLRSAAFIFVPRPGLGLHFSLSLSGERRCQVVNSISSEITVAAELCPKEPTDFHKGVVMGLKIQNYTGTFFYV